jgi:hypothetical protein
MGADHSIISWLDYIMVQFKSRGGGEMLTIPKLRTSIRTLGWLSLGLVLFLAVQTTSFADIGRPDPDAGPTKVEVGLIVLDIDQIDSADQNFDANVYIIVRWTDPRLKHTGRRNSVPLEEVWHPRILLLNQQKVWPTFPEIVSVSPNGQVTYRQRVWGAFSQPLDLRDFPFDDQEISIQLISAGYTQNEVELVVDPLSHMAERLSLPDWDILRWSVDATAIRPIPSVETEVSAVVFSFEASRRVEYFIYQIIVPMILIVAMSWTVFWLNPMHSGTQISVAVTTMLTLIAFRFAAGMDLPKVDYMTKLDFFVLGTTVLIFTTLLQAIVTASMADSGDLVTARKIDLWCRWIFPGSFILLGVETLWLRQIF